MICGLRRVPPFRGRAGSRRSMDEARWLSWQRDCRRDAGRRARGKLARARGGQVALRIVAAGDPADPPRVFQASWSQVSPPGSCGLGTTGIFQSGLPVSASYPAMYARTPD